MLATIVDEFSRFGGLRAERPGRFQEINLTILCDCNRRDLWLDLMEESDILVYDIDALLRELGRFHG